jgi:hypothetical protein
LDGYNNIVSKGSIQININIDMSIISIEFYTS